MTNATALLAVLVFIRAAYDGSGEEVSYRRGLEVVDNSKVINVVWTAERTIPGAQIVVIGQVFHSKHAIKDDGEVSVKVLHDALKQLRTRDVAKLDREQRQSLRKRIDMVEKMAKAARETKPSHFDKVMITIVAGDDQPLHAQFTAPEANASHFIDIQAGKREIDTYTATFRVPKRVGGYTVIITPVDTTTVPGVNLCGGSDCVPLEVIDWPPK